MIHAKYSVKCKTCKCLFLNKCNIVSFGEWVLLVLHQKATNLNTQPPDKAFHLIFLKMF